MITKIEVLKEVVKDIERWHRAGIMLGGACDRGYCECPKIIDYIKEEHGIKDDPQ